MEGSAALTKSSAGGAAGVVRFLRTDALVLVTLVVLAVSVLPYLWPVLDPTAFEFYADSWADLPLLLTLIILMLLGLRRLEPSERPFWHLWTAALGFWVAVRVIGMIVPLESQNHWFDVSVDLLYCAFYLCLAIALELPSSSGSGRDRAVSVTASLIGVATGLLAYVAVIPAALTPGTYQTWVPSLWLYTLLDTYLLVRLGQRWYRAVDPRRRRVLAWLMITVAGWTVTDAIETLSWQEAFPWAWPGSWFDLPWFIPLITLAVAVRLRDYGPAEPLEVRSASPAALPTRIWGGIIGAYAVGFASLHLSVEALGLMSPETAMARSTVVFVVFAVLLILAIQRERALAEGARAALARERALERQLRQAQKMEALGTLAGGVAHDFNNILVAISGYTELARQRVLSEPRAVEDLDFVLRASDRAKGLVRKITAFSRSEGSAAEPIQLGPVVQEALELLRATLPSTIDIRTEFDPDVGLVLAEAGQIYQAVLNLGTNAADAMGERGGELRVSLTSISCPSELPEPIAMSGEGPFVLLTVADTGGGMDPEVLDRVFEPFFTTKPKGTGTGLGLAAVHAIVARYSGGIRVDSKPGEGTVFRLCFPVTSVVPRPSVELAASDTDYRGEERVLVVDDEPAVAAVTERQLERLGYDVTSFTDSDVALEAFTREPGAFDLLVTDQTMPNRTGLQLAAAVHEVRPDLPVLLTTGYSGAVTDEGENGRSIVAVISKPYDRHAIASAIRRAIDQPH